MPFPPNQVFIDYLSLYYTVRSDERASWKTYIKSGIEQVASYATGSSPVVDQLDSNLTKMVATINAAGEFNDWFRLIFTLRQTAAECQDAKWVTGVSLSCLVLHGTASLILREMYKFDEFKAQLSIEISSRIARIEELKKTKNTSLKTKYGQSVNDYNKEIQQLIIELAQLGEISHIEKASKFNLFGYLPKRNEVEIITYTDGKGNRVGLIELQLDFCEWLYAKTFQTTKHIGFDQFLTESATSFQKFLAQQEKNKQRIANADSAAASLQSNPVENSAEANDSPSLLAAAAAAAASSPASSSPSTAGIFSPSAAAAKRGKGRSVNDETATNAASTTATAANRH